VYHSSKLVEIIFLTPQRRVAAALGTEALSFPSPSGCAFFAFCLPRSSLPGPHSANRANSHYWPISGKSAAPCMRKGIFLMAAHGPIRFLHHPTLFRLPPGPRFLKANCLSAGKFRLPGDFQTFFISVSRKVQYSEPFFPIRRGTQRKFYQIPVFKEDPAPDGFGDLNSCFPLSMRPCNKDSSPIFACEARVDGVHRSGCSAVRIGISRGRRRWRV